MAKAQILVVEDEIIIAMDIQDDLENMGYEVIGMVPSGEEAIKCAGELSPDLVLMDIVLEGDMDGITAAEEIRSRFNIPVVYLTAYSDNIILERAKLTEPFGYILKPFDERELQTNIEMALYKHKIEKRLKESQQWLSTTLKSIGDAVIATDKNGLVTFVNPVAESLTGWTHEEALGRDLTEVFKITNKGRPGENPALKALSLGSAVSLEDDTMLISKDNSVRPIDDSAAPIKDDMGKVTGAVLVFHDITDRKKSEEALKDARDKLKALIDASPLAIFSSDKDMKIMSWNGAAERIFGWSEREVLGKTNPCLRPIEKLEANTRMEEVMMGRAFRGIKQRRKRKDGATIDISLSVAPLHDSEGETVGIISIADDVTEKRKMEEQIRFQASLLDQVHNPIIAIDLKGRIIYWNKFAEMLYQWKKEEVVGRRMSEVIIADESIELANRLFEKMGEDRCFEGDLIARRKDGCKLLIYIFCSEIKDTEGNLEGFVGATIDITRLARLEEELKDSYIELENAYTELKENEKAKFDFASLILHELNTPLAVITSYVEMFEDGALGKLNSPQLEKIQIVRNQVDQMIRLVQDMLDTSRLESRKFEIFRTTSRIEEVAACSGEDLSKIASCRSQEICLEADRNLPDIEMDRQRIRQVFNNLLMNAMRYTPAGGRIYIRIEDKGSNVLVSVSDNGIGIAREDLIKVFDRFYTIENAGQPNEESRLGVGLFIAKAIAQAHGGDMWAESVPGKGSTFYFTLPVKPCSEPASDIAKINNM
jgi:PAS domain S-box-containing protein